MPSPTTLIWLTVSFGLLVCLWAYWYATIAKRGARLDRNWSPDCAVIPTVTFHDDDSLTIHDVRHFVWRSSKDFDAVYADETYALSDLVGVWYVVEHFHKLKGLAHVMISFEFKGDRYVTCSFETRRTEGQRYHPWSGCWNAFELLLLWGGEEDLIRLRTNGRKSQVYLFPCVVPDGKGEALFKRICQRANDLAEKPEFYNTIRTTCTTTLVEEINQVTPGRVPFMWRLLLPGHSPRAAYRLGLFKDEEQKGYDAVLAAAAITPKAQAHEGLEGFSQAIRA